MPISRTFLAFFAVAALVGANSPGKIRPGARGRDVLRAQTLLARAHFSCGVLDGQFGSNLSKALAAYQQDRQLPATGAVDEATWEALDTDTAPVLVSYTVSGDDVKGPFIGTVPKDMAAQAALPVMGYTSAEEELAARFHTSVAVLHSLNPGVDLTSVGQQLTVPNAIVLPPGRAARVVVSKSDSSVRAYGADGKLLAYYVATIGSDHDPLPIGNWKILGVSRNPVFHYNPDLFWDAKPGDTKATIQPGPNNPVGLVWIDLSKEHYGIHGTPDPALIGHAFSHGCIRLTNWDALDLAAMVRPGVPVTLEE
jgi:lipoprotein-anchoring transpeptidase ErfK/SrfK